MLAAGTLAQTSFAAIGVGLPAIAPAIRDAFGLSLTQVGAVLSSHWLGTLVTLLPWGILTDRIGERIVLTAGMGGCGLLLIAAGQASTFWQLYVLLFLSGAAGASVNAATGRAVMGWFDASQRGLALGIRQAAVPVGGLIGALVLPQFTVHHAYAFLGGMCLLGAAAGAIFLREPAALPLEVPHVEWSLGDRRLWRLSAVSGLYVVAQMAILSFVVLYLHDERGLGKGEAAAVLGAVQAAAVVLRVGAGRWSDNMRTRTVPLARIGLAMSISLAVATALLNAPLVLLVPAFVVSGSLTMAWNGVAFAAVAELAGRARSGAALSVQQTVLSLAGVAAPLGFAAVVTASSWSIAYGLAAAFPIGGWLVLRTMREPEK
ncbi:MAG TPA: MFS transporter, partial [Gaiellaceae bacterium]|nr:MFS transporter [Gaiellaceae bacterium]